MTRWLHDAWVMLGLACAQMLLTFVFVALVPYGYLVNRSQSNPEIAKNLQAMTDFAESGENKNLTGPQILEAMGPTVRALLEAVPWGILAAAGSVLIYPFLGWWSGRMLHSPQLGGILLVGSVLSLQNIALVPRNIEYWNVASVTLSLPVVLLLVVLQFVLFTGGIMVQRGQALAASSQSKENISE